MHPGNSNANMPPALTMNRTPYALNHKGIVIWFTGLPCSGKTTLATGLEEELYQSGFKTCLLDGDNIRSGLCSDLGFSDEDRTENIRRVGEVAKLMMETGIVVIVALISPFAKDRDWVRNRIGENNLIRIFLDCPVEICIKRDVKGLYGKARNGEIKNFTGVSSQFEMPEASELTLKTAEFSKELLITEIVTCVKQKLN